MDIDVTVLSLVDLQQLQKDVKKQIRYKETSDKKDTLLALKALAEQRGFTLRQLVGKSAKKTATPKGNGDGELAPPKKSGPPIYFHPANSKKSWTGKGRKPKWVQHFLDQGKQLDDLKIAVQPTTQPEA